MNFLINRRIMNTKSKKIYRITHLPKEYGDGAINAGHFYLPIFDLKTRKPNVLQINKRNYEEYIVLEVLYNNKDEEATKMFHALTCSLN